MHNAVNEDKPRILRSILLFLVLTVVLSGIFNLLIIAAGTIEAGASRYIMGVMWGPGLAALLTCKLLGQDLDTLGWRWGRSRYQWVSYLTPLAYSALAYSVLWLAGLGGVPNPAFIKKAADSFGWQSYSSAAVIGWQAVLIGTFGVIKGCANTLGEELGWRGFLVPALMKLTTYTRTSLLTGIIWAAWHFPSLIFANYNNGTELGFELACFTLMIVSSCFAYTWLRIKSGSVWTGVIFHSSHNMFIQALFTPLTIDTGKTKYWSDEFGIMLVGISVVTGFIFWLKREELPCTTATGASPVGERMT